MTGMLVKEKTKTKRRCIIADSSSIILLQKSALLENVMRGYRMAVALQVYHELVGGGKKGSEELRRLLCKHIEVPVKEPFIHGMGLGECAVITLFYEGIGDFVVIDDKKGAQYCRQHAIPFVNSLLLCRVMYLAGSVKEETYRKTTKALMERGYYSDRIVATAASMSEEELQRFFPTQAGDTN